MEGAHLLIIVAAVVIIGGIAYAAHVAQQQRIHELGALAIRLGWQFDLREDRELPQRYSFFNVFDQGDDRRAYNTLTGGIEVDGQRWNALAGDYRYETTSGTGKDRRTTTHRLSYVIVETPHVDAPQLAIRREVFMDRFAGFLGFDDIDFESAEFSEKFHVKSPNKRFAYAVLDPRMMEFLLDGQPPTLEFRRGQCCLHDRERVMTADEVAATIDFAREFFTRWPKHVPTIFDA
jgi:hypothetical protein